MSDTPKVGILDKSLGELLKNNNQAQGMIMQAMQITPAQFAELVKMTGNNEIMNMSIGDLFKKGVVQQAQTTQGQGFKQIDPSQIQAVVNMMQSAQNKAGNNGNAVVDSGQQIIEGNAVPVENVNNASLGSGKNLSFWQKLKSLFG